MLFLFLIATTLTAEYSLHLMSVLLQRMNNTYPDQIREGGPNPLVYLVQGGPNLLVNMARRTNFTSGFGPAGPKIARTNFTVTPA